MRWPTRNCSGFRISPRAASSSTGSDTAPAPSSLEELIESVLFFHETEIKMRTISLERRYRKRRKVLCHPGEFRQVITNLIGNALDALPRHGRLVVGGSARHGRGRPARAWPSRLPTTVRGMDREMLDRLFHPFATTKGEAGTGLGLWVSKGISTSTMARIAVRSRALIAAPSSGFSCQRKRRRTKINCYEYSQILMNQLGSMVTSSTILVVTPSFRLFRRSQR